MIIAMLRSTAFTLNPAKDFGIGNLLILPLPAFSRRLHNSFLGLYLYGRTGKRGQFSGDLALAIQKLASRRLLRIKGIWG
jgi:hypothetical protein